MSTFADDMAAANTLYRNRLLPVKPCEEFARKGTGYGVCDRPVDPKTGLCDRPDQHTTQEEINPEPRHRWVGSRPTLEQY